MKNSLFQFGGGAGIGSYVIVIRDGELQQVRAEVVRESYDKGENLYLSIIDDTTEEALLPLSGYVDNEGILHLSGRDFDDNKTYEFTVNNIEQTISVEEKEGVTIGETTIPTSGGTQLYKHTMLLQDNIQGDIYDVTLVLINTDSTSYTGKETYQVPNNFISAWLIQWSGEEQTRRNIIGLAHTYDGIFEYINSSGNPSSVTPEGPIISDTVTPL